jgi:hypothetical protein
VAVPALSELAQPYPGAKAIDLSKGQYIRSSGNSTGNGPYTRDEWLKQVPTSGGHSQFPSDRLEELLAGIGAAIDSAW